MKRKPHYTEWAALFATGAELTRRGYDVALTLGRTPKVDLLCSVPDGESFKVQVKGMSNHAGPWIQKHFFDDQEEPRLFFITVNVPFGDKEPFEFFIMTHGDIKYIWGKRRRPTRAGFEGLSYEEIKDYEDKWKKLPPITKEET
ncbi:MAG: hypothetical protein ACKKMV_00420 [Candidatus Nealsonbacteria bacterium]